MKKLQNNFTIPEQSKRLLELGVPANSADCYWYEYDLKRKNREYRCPHVRNNHTYRFADFFRCFGFGYIPCWSVGRLREIFCICSSVNGTREYPFCNDQAAWWITEFEFKKEFIDFSKLED